MPALCECKCTYVWAGFLFPFTTMKAIFHHLNSKISINLSKVYHLTCHVHNLVFHLLNETASTKRLIHTCLININLHRWEIKKKRKTKQKLYFVCVSFSSFFYSIQVFRFILWIVVHTHTRNGVFVCAYIIKI